MTDKEKDNAMIGSNFWRSFATICTIVATSVMGFKYLRTEITNDIKDQMRPLVERVEKLENNSSVYSESISMIQAIHNCMNTQTDFLNKKFSKEFLKPDDIIVTPGGKRK